MENEKKNIKARWADSDRIMKLKDITRSLKWISILVMIFCTIFSLLILVEGTLTTLDFNTKTKEQILNDENIIDYMAKINDYSILDAQKTISEIENSGNKTFIMIFDIIIPSLTVLLALGLILAFCKALLDFIKDVKSNKSLFTLEKLNSLKKARTILLTAFLFFWIVFGFKYFTIYLVLEITVEIILYLFDYCVKVENGKVTE